MQVNYVVLGTRWSKRGLQWNVLDSNHGNESKIEQTFVVDDDDTHNTFMSLDSLDSLLNFSSLKLNTSAFTYLLHIHYYNTGSYDKYHFLEFFNVDQQTQKPLLC